MKLTISLFLILIFFAADLAAQKKTIVRNADPPRSRQAVVIDERLAVLRQSPGFYGNVIQRFRRGREMTMLGSKQVDGATFYRVSISPKSTGWIQSDALVISGADNDDVRLARLVYSSKGFDQIERAAIFLKYFRVSDLRPQILLLFGDLLEETSLQLSKEAARSFDLGEMAANGAPLHSFYMNYPGLDRYRRLGVGFLFKVETRRFHYNGAAWKELAEKFQNSAESTEAKKRLELLTDNFSVARP